MGLFQKRLTGFCFLFYILIFIYFFEYETIFRSSAWSFGHSDSNPSSVSRIEVLQNCSAFFVSLSLAREFLFNKIRTVVLLCINYTVFWRDPCLNWTYFRSLILWMDISIVMVIWKLGQSKCLRIIIENSLFYQATCFKDFYGGK